MSVDLGRAARSRRVLLVLGALSAFGAISIDMYLPALPAIGTDLDAGAREVQLTLSAFFVGFGAGQLVYGPLSDRLGRKPVLLAGIALYVATSALCATSASVDALVLWRLAHAVGASAGAVIARAIVRDLHGRDSAARALSMIMMVMAIAPLLAPLLGGQLLVHLGWRSIFWALAGFGGLCLVAAALAIPETWPRDRRTGAGHSTLGAYAALLRHRTALGCMLAGGLAFAGMFAYISGSPFVYIQVFGVSPQHYGLLFGLNVAGIIGASWINSRLVTRVGAERMLAFGVSVSSVGGLALLTVAALDAGGLPAIVATLFVFVSTIGLIGANAVAGALAPFPELAGAASALFGAIQFGLGAVAGVAVGMLHDGSALPMAAVVAVAGAGALLAQRLLVPVRRRPEA